MSAIKRWHYLIFIAALGSIGMEFIWAAHLFGPTDFPTTRNIFLAIEFEFVLICLGRWADKEENWGVLAAALTGLAAIVFCMVAFVDVPANIRLFLSLPRKYDPGFIFPTLMIAGAGLIALAVAGRAAPKRSNQFAAIIALALAFTWLAEWIWHARVFRSDQPGLALAWYVAVFVLFAVVPYFCGVDRVWTWTISAMAGPLQFWFVDRLVQARFDLEWKGLVPLAFALPAAAGVAFLIKKERLPLSSGDTRLAVQGAAVLAFISFIFPVQFEHEWIALGWAIEGLGLILLFRLIPNRRLRAVALIVFCAAFVRLVLNPAVFNYHPRSGVPILNWYFYVYGVAAVCLFFGGWCFNQPLDRPWERAGRPLLYSLAGIVCFLLMNVEIADYFSIGPTLTFSFTGDFARDMTYTIAWALFAFGLLVVGISRKIRPARFAGIGLFCVALGKLFLHDLASLSQLYRIGAFIAVAIILIVASFAYQRFLSPAGEKKAAN